MRTGIGNRIGVGTGYRSKTRVGTVTRNRTRTRIGTRIGVGMGVGTGNRIGMDIRVAVGKCIGITATSLTHGAASDGSYTMFSELLLPCSSSERE
jgi:hypothetical protein